MEESLGEDILHCALESLGTVDCDLVKDEAAYLGSALESLGTVDCVSFRPILENEYRLVF